MKPGTALAAAAMILVPLVAPAVDTDPSPATAGEYAAGRKAVEAKDWPDAIKRLRSAAQQEPGNADVQNLLGYAYRNAGQLELAFRHYRQALQLDPRHRGAHEYIGEAYLMAGDPTSAEKHLAALGKICGKCGEYDDLVKSIERYRTSRK